MSGAPLRIVKWTGAGGLLGAVLALGVWLLRAPLEAGTRSGAEARFEIVPLQPEERAPRSGGGEASASFAERRSFSATAVDPEFGVLAFGHVVDDAGAALEGARLTLEDREARLFETKAGFEGAWTLHGVVPGAHELRVSMRGFLPYAEEVDVPGARGWRHDVRLEPALTLPVRFEDPLGEALELERFQAAGLARYLGVSATRAAPAARIPDLRGRVAVRSEAGRFDSRAEGDLPADLGPRHQGVLCLTAEPPLWVSLVLRDVVLETRRLYGAEEELVFVVDQATLEANRGEVRVRIVERGSGAPITAGVMLEHPSGGLSVSPRVDDGTLVFERVAPGRLDLLLRQGDWEWLERSVDVPPGGLVELGTIALGRRQSFRVHLVDAEGLPVSEGAWLRAVRPALVAGPEDQGQRIGIRVDAQGTAEIQHLAAGLTLLRAGGRDGLAQVARLVDTSRETDVKLVVPRGTPVVLLRHDQAPPGVVYVLEDENGLALAAGTWLARDMCLPPGRYTLIGTAGSSEVERVGFRVDATRVVVRYGGS